MWSPTQYCDFAHLTLQFVRRGVYQAPRGVNVSAPYFGGVLGCDYLDTNKGSGGYVPVWAAVLEQLVTYSRFVPGVDVRAATYDWRLGPDALLAAGYVDRVRALIVDMWSSAGGQPVVVASMSEGGPVAALVL